MEWKALCKTTKPKFPLGALLFSAGFNRLVHEGLIDPVPLLQRHVRGDWGDMDDEDKQINDDALKAHCRLFSAYEVPPHYRVWVITEADRSTTTMLLPEDY